MLPPLRAALLALAALFAVTAGAQAGTPCPGADTAERDLKTARAALLTIPTGDGMQTDVSKAAWAKIARGRAAEAAFVLAVAACHPGDVKALSAVLTKASIDGADDDGRYGSSLTFGVTTIRPGLIAVAATINIECGGDTMLMLLEVGPGGWREVLRFQSPPYKEVSGGVIMLNFEISPPDAKGHWFFAESNVLPWCSSTWSGIHYTVLRPSGDPLKPVRVLEATDDIWWGNEDFGRLKVGRSDFMLRFHAGSIDGGVHNREYIRHFAIDGNTARRILPSAETANNFAEEWIQSDWTAIAAWTANPNLKPVHDAMHKEPYFEYASVRACPGGATEIGVTKAKLEDKDPDADKPYYLLVGKGPDYRMLDVAGIHHAACTGRNTWDPQ
jgi:hypothetical protein